MFSSGESQLEKVKGQARPLYTSTQTQLTWKHLNSGYINTAYAFNNDALGNLFQFVAAAHFFSTRYLLSYYCLSVYLGV